MKQHSMTRVAIAIAALGLLAGSANRRNAKYRSCRFRYGQPQNGRSSGYTAGKRDLNAMDKPGPT